ncbi:MAG: DUF6524 family protein [Enterobacterales bacterium]|nr:DUF6524 family protein [Enterobacterales bacterium]
MASNNQLTTGGFYLRLLFALVLVFVTYNPSPYSYYDWLLANIESFNVLVIPLGIVLLIGWSIYIRATLRSLGLWGLLLAVGLFGSLIWVLIDWKWLDVNNISVLSWIVEAIIALVLGVGMSWSHIRRKMSGQVDIEDGQEE